MNCRDMIEERNVLSKYIFPEVRRVCSERNINFVEVGELYNKSFRKVNFTNQIPDLRWGITKEEASGGQVISLCLNEVLSSG